MSWSKREEEAFALVLLAMGELFNEPVSAVRAEMFCRAVEDVPFAAMNHAAQQHARSSKFFPRPADLRELVAGPVDDQAELAWQYVVREVRRVGWAGVPAWPDEATKLTALGLFGGGWRTLCENLPASGPELLGYRKQFVASFGASARQADVNRLPPSREDAKKTLADLKARLKQRGLPTGDL